MGKASREKWERRTQEFWKAFNRGGFNAGEEYRGKFKRATKILFTADRLVKAQKDASVRGDK